MMYDTDHMNKRTLYHPIAKFFHWTIVVLIAIQFVSGWLMPSMRHGAGPNSFTFAHLSLGLLVAPFAMALLFMRFYKPVARPEMETATNLIKIATTSTHYLLYTLLVTLSISGAVAASLRGVVVNFFGLFDIPYFVISNPSLLRSLGEMHSALATAIGIVAIGHIAAALYHHVVLKDSVLERMRPTRSL